MKEQVMYKLVGIQKGLSYKSSLIFKNLKSDLEINCELDRINIIHDLISKEDILYIKYLSNYMQKNKETKI
jgi:hypothetical protein